jgi:hypothetical protein
MLMICRVEKFPRRFVWIIEEISPTWDGASFHFLNPERALRLRRPPPDSILFYKPQAISRARPGPPGADRALAGPTLPADGHEQRPVVSGPHVEATPGAFPAQRGACLTVAGA